jgi:hypothetical protein
LHSTVTVVRFFLIKFLANEERRDVHAYKIIERGAICAVDAHQVTGTLGGWMERVVVGVVAGDDDTLIGALFCELDLAVLVFALLDALLAGRVGGRAIDGEVCKGARGRVGGGAVHAEEGDGGPYVAVCVSGGGLGKRRGTRGGRVALRMVAWMA